MAAVRLAPAHPQQPGQSASLQAGAQGLQGGIHGQALPERQGLRRIHRQRAPQLLVDRIPERPHAIEPIVATLQLQQYQYPLGAAWGGLGPS